MISGRIDVTNLAMPELQSGNVAYDLQEGRCDISDKEGNSNWS